MNRPFSPEHHDFYPTDEIRKLERQNGEFLRAFYDGRVAEFRADVHQTLQRVGALSLPNGGWAVFDFIENGGCGGIATAGEVKQLAVIYIKGVMDRAGKLIPPLIRLIQQELFVIQDETTAWLTTDVSVDPDGDCMQYMGMGTNQLVEEKKTRAVAFGVEDGCLAFTNNFSQGTTELVGIADEADNPLAYPFGSFTCLEDNIAALQLARKVFDSIEDRVPAYVATKSS